MAQALKHALESFQQVDGNAFPMAERSTSLKSGCHRSSMKITLGSASRLGLLY